MPEDQDERDVRGRFLPGNRGGPGRPRQRLGEKDYMAATTASCSLADWYAITRRAVEQARRGDAKARDWLGRLLVGSDPIPLAQLVQELREEVERLKARGTHSHNGTAAHR
jgi:hypothetical protein